MMKATTSGIVGRHSTEFEVLLEQFQTAAAQVNGTSHNACSMSQLSEPLQRGLQALHDIDQHISLNPLTYQRIPSFYDPASQGATQANINYHTARALKDVDRGAEILAWKKVTGIKVFNIRNPEHVAKFVLLSGNEKDIRKLNETTVKQVMPELLNQIAEYNTTIHPNGVNGFINFVTRNSWSLGTFGRLLLDALKPEAILIKPGVITRSHGSYSFLVKTSEGQALYQQFGKQAFSMEAQYAYQSELSAFRHRNQGATQEQPQPTANKPQKGYTARPQQPAADQEDLSSAGLPTTESAMMDQMAAHIMREFDGDGAVAGFYQTYSTSTVNGDDQSKHQRYMTFLTAVHKHCQSERTIKSWIGCGQKLADFALQIANVTQTPQLAKFATSVGGLTQAVYGVREFTNGIQLLKATQDAGSIAMGLGNLMSGAGAVVGAISLACSLFGGNRDNQIDYAAATYEVVNVLRDELRQGFIAMQENFRVTLRAIQELREENRILFERMTVVLENRLSRMELRQEQQFSMMNQRFDQIEWRLDDLAQRADRAAALKELVGIFRTNQDWAALVNQFSQPINSVLNGRQLTGTAQDEAREISLISNPIFSLRTLDSYLMTHISKENRLYSRSQLQRVLSELHVSHLAPVCGIECLIPPVDGNMQSLTHQIIRVLAGEQALIPLELLGSFVLLHVDRRNLVVTGGPDKENHSNDQLTVYVLAEAREGCQSLLRGIIPSTFKQTVQAYPETVGHQDTGIYCAQLIEWLLQTNGLMQPLPPLNHDKKQQYARWIGELSAEERCLDNPFVQLWVALSLQRIDTTDRDHKTEISRLQAVMKRMSNQAAMLVRASHPQLLASLNSAYQVAITEFITAFNVWSADTAQRFFNREKDRIKTFFHQSLRGVFSGNMNAMDPSMWPREVHLNDQFPGWWERQYQHHNRRDGVYPRTNAGPMPRGQASRDSHYELALETAKRSLVDTVIHNISAEEVTMNSHQSGLTCLRLGKPPVINTDTLALKAIYPRATAPQSPTLILRAPDEMTRRLPITLRQAYLLGLIHIQFTYEVNTTPTQVLIVRVEYKVISAPNQPENSWCEYSRYSYDFDPAIYSGTEAIWRYWEGGSMPLTLGTSSREYSRTGTNQFGNFDVHYMNFPTLAARRGMVGCPLPEDAVSDEQKSNMDANLRHLLQTWQDKLENQAAEELKVELRGSGALKQAVDKMDQYVRLIKSFIELGRFGLQLPTLHQSLLNHLNAGMYTSTEMFDVLTNSPSIAVFINRLPQANTVFPEADKAPLPPLTSPFVLALTILLSDIRGRISEEHNHLLPIKRRFIDSALKYMEMSTVKFVAGADRSYQESLEQERDEVVKKYTKMEEEIKSALEKNREIHQTAGAKLEKLRECMAEIQNHVIDAEELYAQRLISRDELARIQNWAADFVAVYTQLLDKHGQFSQQFETEPKFEMPYSGFRFFKPSEKAEKRFSQQSPAPDKQIPQGLRLENVPGDGDCFYHAVGRYIRQTPEELRQRIATALENSPNDYADIIDVINALEAGGLNSFLAGVRGNGWADSYEVSILMRLLNRPIVVIQNGAPINRADASLYQHGEPIFVHYNGLHATLGHYAALVVENPALRSARNIFTALLETTTDAEPPETVSPR